MVTRLFIGLVLVKLKSALTSTCRAKTTEKHTYKAIVVRLLLVVKANPAVLANLHHGPELPWYKFIGAYAERFAFGLATGRSLQYQCKQ